MPQKSSLTTKVYCLFYLKRQLANIQKNQYRSLFWSFFLYEKSEKITTMTTISYWFNKFKRCRTFVFDEETMGNMVNKTHDIVLADDRVKIRDRDCWHSKYVCWTRTQKNWTWKNYHRVWRNMDSSLYARRTDNLLGQFNVEWMMKLPYFGKKILLCYGDNAPNYSSAIATANYATNCGFIYPILRILPHVISWPWKYCLAESGLSMETYFTDFFDDLKAYRSGKMV